VIDSCRACGAQRQIVLLPGSSVTVGPVRASAESRRSVRCPSCSPSDRTKSTDGALAVAIGRAIGQIVIGAFDRQRRERIARCGACAERLDLPMRATTRAVTIEAEDEPPFTLTLQLPMVRCGGCGCDNVPPEIGPDVRVGAFRACGLSATGRPTSGRGAGSLSWLRRRGGQGSPGHP
jgi:hypothetical protein